MTVTGVFRRADRLARELRSSLRIWWYRLLYPGLKIGRSVHLGPGTWIAVANDARLVIGDRTVIEKNCYLVSRGVVEIGPDSFVGQGGVIVAIDRVSIGRDALIASGVVIRDQDHGRGSPHRLEPLVSAPISVGTNVWIGANVAVLKGVTIGDNAVIGAGAVVTKAIPANATAIGVPAHPLRN